MAGEWVEESEAVAVFMRLGIRGAVIRIDVSDREKALAEFKKRISKFDVTIVRIAAVGSIVNAILKEIYKSVVVDEAMLEKVIGVPLFEEDKDDVDKDKEEDEEEEDEEEEDEEEEVPLHKIAREVFEKNMMDLREKYSEAAQMKLEQVCGEKGLIHLQGNILEKVFGYFAKNHFTFDHGPEHLEKSIRVIVDSLEYSLVKKVTIDNLQIVQDALNREDLEEDLASLAVQEEEILRRRRMLKESSLSCPSCRNAHVSGHSKKRMRTPEELELV